MKAEELISQGETMSDLIYFTPSKSEEAGAIMDWIRLAKPVQCFELQEMCVTAINGNSAFVPLTNKGVDLLDKNEYEIVAQELRAPFGKNAQYVEVEFDDGTRYVVDLHLHSFWVLSREHCEFRVF